MAYRDKINFSVHKIYFIPTKKIFVNKKKKNLMNLFYD